MGMNLVEIAHTDASPVHPILQIGIIDPVNTVSPAMSIVFEHLEVGAVDPGLGAADHHSTRLIPSWWQAIAWHTDVFMRCMSKRHKLKVPIIEICQRLLKMIRLPGVIIIDAGDVGAADIGKGRVQWIDRAGVPVVPWVVGVMEIPWRVQHLEAAISRPPHIVVTAVLHDDDLHVLVRLRQDGRQTAIDQKVCAVMCRYQDRDCRGQRGGFRC